MKKKYALLMLCVFMITSGCSQTSNSNTTNTESSNSATDPYNRVEERDSGLTCVFSSLPYEMDYNGSKIIFDSADFVQTKSASGHGYIPYLAITLDTSNVSEDDLYWMDKNEDISFLANITCESNNIESEPMQCVGMANYGDKRVYTFSVLEEQKEEFVPSSFYCSFEIRQEDTYKYNDSELQKYNWYQYFGKINSIDEIKDTTVFDDKTIEIINSTLDILGSPERIAV